MLAERVAAGELPSVKERLPKLPYLVRPDGLVGADAVDLRPGAFGGTLDIPQRNQNFDGAIAFANLEPLLWIPGGLTAVMGDTGETQKFEGNVVAGYEVNDDQTAFTFHMRDGLRWSDGQPVTTQDVKFAFEDVLYNELLTPGLPSYLRTGQRPDGAPAQLELVDDLTFSLKFDGPYGSFPAQLAVAGGRGYGDIIKPRHYLEQLHADYADPNRLKKLLKDESIPEDEWFQLFNTKQDGATQNVSARVKKDTPKLTPWIMTTAGDATLRYERNPYYFKVDAEGNQLPYIDELHARVVQDQENLASRALFGEFDYPGEKMSLRQLPLLADRRESGELNLITVRDDRVPISFELNLTHPDDAWRRIATDVRFREALSLSINRQEIIETFFAGEFGEPSEQLASSDFDVDRANQLLDEMGLTQRDGDGFRTTQGDEAVQLPLLVVDSTEHVIPITELVIEYWKNIGIDATFRQVDQIHGIIGNDDIKATVGTSVSDPDLWDSTVAFGYLPDEFSRWGLLWHRWAESNGEDGEEPPDELKEIFDVREQLVSSPVGSSAGVNAANAIIENYRQNLWTIVPIEASFVPTFFSPRVKNVPTGMQEQLLSRDLVMSMEQWYIEE